MEEPGCLAKDGLMLEIHLLKLSLGGREGVGEVRDRVRYGTDFQAEYGAQGRLKG